MVRVHNLVPEEVWSNRYEEINDLRRVLAENGTHILKFYLHISKDEQLRRFKQRIDDPSKHWKISDADYSEREYWDDYIEAFEDALTKCSTEHAPWFVIPANHKWFRNLAVSQIVVEYLEDLGMKPPPPSVDIEQIHKEYHEAKEDPSARRRREVSMPFAVDKSLVIKSARYPLAATSINTWQ